MLAIHLTRFGEPEQSLKVVDVPAPGAPAAGQALVQVEYAPLDHHDLLLAQGVYPVRPELPSVIGNEGAGTVLAIGPDVTRVRPGDTVLLPFGTFAWSEQVLAEAAKLTVVDKSNDPVLLGLDGVSGKATSLLLDVLTDGALLVVYGYMSGDPFTPDQNVLRAKNITTTEFWMYEDKYLPRHQALSAESAQLVARGVAQHLPGARVVKALNTLFAPFIAADPRHTEGRQVAFYAGDDADAKAVVADLLDTFGFAVLDLGGLREGGRLMQLDGALSGKHLLLQDVG
jgi:NADPH:quinone reductase-like Zn-dependent oxidoreductase